VQENTCYSADQLFAVFDVDHDAISADDIQKLCPALLQQKLTGSCVEKEVKTTLQGPSDPERSWYLTTVLCYTQLDSSIYPPLRPIFM